MPSAIRDEVDPSEYPDDFEDADDEDLVEVVCNAKCAMEVMAENNVFEEELQQREGGRLSATIKILREKCVGKCKCNCKCSTEPKGVIFSLQIQYYCLTYTINPIISPIKCSLHIKYIFTLRNV